MPSLVHFHSLVSLNPDHIYFDHFLVVVIFGLWLTLAGTKDNVLPAIEYTGLDIDKKDHAMWTSRFLFDCTIFISKD